MKLAEALIERADLQRRIEQLKTRLVRNARVQEGESPAEDPGGLLSELDRDIRRLIELIQKINRTNAATSLEGNSTLADALAVRDALSMRHAIYRELAKAATIVQELSTKSEVKFASTVSVADVQRQGDDVARERRELDAKIQAANWEIELIE
jgi:hypothetical protein